MKLSVLLVVLLAHICFAQNYSNLELFDQNFEYDTNRNGWFIGSPANPITLNNGPPKTNTVPEIYRDFVNRTLAKQPTGVCQKEVP